MITFDIRHLGGPSLFADSSCVCLTLAFSQADKERLLHYEEEAIKAFGDRLPEVEVNPVEGFFLVDVVASLTVFLLKKLEARRGEPWVSRDTSGALYYIAFSGEQTKNITKALGVSVRIVAQLYPVAFEGLFPDWSLKRNPVAEWEKFLEEEKQDSSGRSLSAIHAALNERRIPWLSLERFSGNRDFIQIGYGRYQYLFEGTVSFECSWLGVIMSLNKRKSREYLASMGFPVTQQCFAPTEGEAQAAAEVIGYPVVMKPVRGTHGNHVHVNLRDRAEVLQAFQMIKQARRKKRPAEPNPIIVENYVKGEDYRLTVIGGQVLAFHRMPAQVVADGKSNIAELIELENKNPLRGAKGTLETIYIHLKLNAPELATLKKYGLTPISVPPPGKVVLLRENANWSSGGCYEDVTSVIHPDNVALVKRIAAVFKIDLLGVDVIAEDISQSFLDGRLRVIEVNHSPAIFGVEGDDVNPSERRASIVDLMMPLAAERHVPIIVVSRGRYSRHLTRALGEALSGIGLAPGVVNDLGMFIGGEQWANSESLDYSDPVLPVLRNKEIDSAVIERGFPSMLDTGVGTGGCDISVILSIPEGEVKTGVWKNGVAFSAGAKMLLRRARKASVVFVDNAEVASWVDCVDASRLCVLSLDQQSELVTRLVSQGAKAVVMQTIALDGISVQVVMGDSGDTRRSKSFFIEMVDLDEVSILSKMAVMGVLVCLGYSLEGLARADAKWEASRDEGGGGQAVMPRSKIFFNHNIESSGPGWVELSRLHSSRALCLTEPGDVIQLPRALLPQGATILAHYERIGLSFTRQVIWDLRFERAREYPDHQPSVYFFGDFEHQICPDPARHKITQRLNSKNELITMARKMGIAIPPTLCFDQLSDVAARLGEVEFPCYVKPSVSLSGIGISRCGNREALDWVLKKIPINIPLQIQKEIAAECFISVQYAIQNGRLERWQISEQVLDDYVHSGNRVPTQYAPWKLLDKFAESIQQQGMQEAFNFDLAVTHDGDGTSFYLLECNPRFSAGSYPIRLAEKLGVSQWSTATVRTRLRDLKRINFSGIEYDAAIKEGVILINWGSILQGKLLLMMVGDRVRQKGLLEKFKLRVCAE